MGARAAHGDGSCQLVRAGKHLGKWRVQTFVQDGLGGKKRLSRLYSTQREGKEFLRSLIRDTDKATALALKEVTVSEWFDWLAENDWSEELDVKTIAYRKARFEKYAKNRWGSIPLTKVDPIEVKAFYKHLREIGVGHATRIALRSDLVRMFNQAVDPYRKVPGTWGNPFRLTIDRPEVRVAVALTPVEAQQAIGNKKLSPELRGMLGVFLLGGVRLSEQMALTVRQVRFTEGLITIDQAVHLSEKGKQQIGLPKRDKKRLAILIPELAELLHPLCEGKAPDSYIWSAKSANKPRTKKRVYEDWETIISSCGLPEEMSPQDCRLSHNNWIEKLCLDVSETTRKEHIGHAGYGVNEVNYTRPITPAQNLLRLSLSVLFAPATESDAA